jgi:hypothetical protein
VQSACGRRKAADQTDFAGVRHVEPGDETQQGRFATTARAKDANGTPLKHLD